MLRLEYNRTPMSKEHLIKQIRNIFERPTYQNSSDGDRESPEKQQLVYWSCRLFPLSLPANLAHVPLTAFASRFRSPKEFKAKRLAVTSTTMAQRPPCTSRSALQADSTPENSLVSLLYRGFLLEQEQNRPVPRPMASPPQAPSRERRLSPTELHELLDEVLAGAPFPPLTEDDQAPVHPAQSRSSGDPLDETGPSGTENGTDKHLPLQ
jgi:hypothetical protein